MEVPVQHGKSELGSVWFPSWWRLTFPNDPIIQTGHTDGLVREWSRRVRENVRDFGHLFPGHPRLDPASTAVNQWNLRRPHRGIYVGASVLATPTGRGGRLIGIDDPIKTPDQAYSPEQRDRMWRWWQFGIRTRLDARRGVLVIIMSRWHEDDLVGRLLKAQEKGEEQGTGNRAFHFRVLRLPALAEPTEAEPDPLGRPYGAALCPPRASRLELEAIRDAPGGAGQQAFEALYQNRPAAMAGGMFEVDKWRILGGLPQDFTRQGGASLVRRWDLASSEAKSGSDPDWTAGVLFSRNKLGQTMVLDARRIRAHPAEVDRFIASTHKDDLQRHKCNVVRIAQSPGEGRIVLSHMSRFVVPTADFGGEPEKGDKEIRARPFASQVHDGHVSLLQAPWNDEYIEEHRVFPHGTHDDWVDASAHAYNDLAAGAGVDVHKPYRTARRPR